MTAPATQLVARALGIQSEVRTDDDMASLPAWDSLAHTALVLEIEAEIGRQLSPEEIAGIDSVAAVAALLAAAGR